MTLASWSAEAKLGSGFGVGRENKPMKSLLLSLASGVVLISRMECGAADPVVVDCVGLRSGMSVSEASERLKSYNPKLEVRSIEIQIPSLGEKPVLERLLGVRHAVPAGNTKAPAQGGPFLRAPPPPPTGEPLESLQAAITLPPNKPLVWNVVRILCFEQGAEQSKTALFTALAQKYGKESVTIDRGFGNISRLWVRNPQGNLIEGQDAEECSTFWQAYEHAYPDILGGGGFSIPALKEPPRTYVMAEAPTNIFTRSDFLNGLATITYRNMLDHPAKVPEQLQKCQTMTYVAAELSVGANREIVNRIRLSVVDAGLELQSKGATHALIKQTETGQEEQRVERAKQQEKPKF